MSNFQLILLSGLNRPVRETRPSGTFSLIPFRTRIELEMAAEKAAEREITAQELASWWTPKEAATYALSCEGIDGAKRAGNAIWQRFAGGLIEVAASSLSVTQGNCSPTIYNQPALLPAHLWEKFTNTGSDVWGTGDVKFLSRRTDGNDETYRFFGIRLNPADIRATLPPPKPKKKWIQKPPPEPASEPEPGQQEKGPPVSEQHLRTWYGLYQQVYQGASDTEATAIKSATGMFPGKSVSRDKVRALRGSQKRGRKPVETAK